MRSRYVSVLLAASALAVMTAGTAGAAPAQHTRTYATASPSRSARAGSPLTAAAPATPGCVTEAGTRYCVVLTQDIPSLPLPYNTPVIFQRSNGIPVIVGVEYIEITCWYYGNPPSGWASDGVLDHAIAPAVGHISDVYVNLGDRNPWQSPYDLPEC
jgi:hypothetical protein